MKARQSLRPQDILVVLKLVTLKGEPSRQIDLALSLGLSQAEVGFSLARLRILGFLSPLTNTPYMGALLDFLVYGLKHVFPTEIGRFVRGTPTSSSASPLSSKFRLPPEAVLVWPDPEGKVRGQSLEPLYPSIPEAAKKDEKLYELLALTDALRAGGTREVELAKVELTKRLGLITKSLKRA